MSPSNRLTQLPFFDITGEQRLLDCPVGRDGLVRVASDDWCDLIEVLARELNVPYAALLRHPKYGQSLEAVHDLMETGVYELPDDSPMRPLRERRFRERREIFEKRAAAVAAGGYVASPVSPRTAKRPWQLPELDPSTYGEYDPSSKSALGSFVDWPSPRVILRRRLASRSDDSDTGHVSEGEPASAARSSMDTSCSEEAAARPMLRLDCLSGTSPVSSGLSRASGSPSAEEVLACKRERQAQEEACEASCKRSRRDPMSAASAASPGLSFSGSSSPAPLSAASASSLSSASSSCSSARPRRVRRAPRQQTACQASRSRSEGLAGLSKSLDINFSELLSSHMCSVAIQA
eukprot:tig00022075_g23631.t1